VRRRRTTSRKPAKARQATKAKRGAASEPARNRRVSALTEDTEVARLARELVEAREQQTATSEILEVISRSAFDLKVLFETVAESSVRLCGANRAFIYRFDGELLRVAAAFNAPPKLQEWLEQRPIRAGRQGAAARAALEGRTIHIPDVLADPEYSWGVKDVEAVRTVLAVPILKGDELLGVMIIYHLEEVRPFTNNQIALVETFADQAVIAIENVRLLNELRDSLDQQTATSQVLRVILSSLGELEPVFNAILENATRICEAKFGNMYLREHDAFRLAAIHNTPRALVENRTRKPFRPGDRDSVFGKAARTKQVVHVADIAAEQPYIEGDPGMVAAVKLGGMRTVLMVPMLKDDDLIGVLSIYRQEVRPFSEKQIELVKSFANQAVIAVENARLLSELRTRTAELQRERNNKLMNLQAMAASISHEVRQPLTGIVSNGSAALRFLSLAPPNLDEARSALNSMVRDSHRASQVFDNLGALFGKAEQRHEPLDMNELAAGILEMLRHDLKAHGVSVRAAFAPELPLVPGHRGQLQEVLVNLVRNAIEAMDAVVDDRRMLHLATERHGDGAILVMVEDSGPGLDREQLDGVFDAFVTSKPNGMGLGLAICRMIIERHAGQLSASPAHPHGCIFRVILPCAP
jgi:signal transduction histidine kinase